MCLYTCKICHFLLVQNSTCHFLYSVIPVFYYSFVLNPISDAESFSFPLQTISFSLTTRINCFLFPGVFEARVNRLQYKLHQAKTLPMVFANPA